jgi:hypothetical protein
LGLSRDTTPLRLLLLNAHAAAVLNAPMAVRSEGIAFINT